MSSRLQRIFVYGGLPVAVVMASAMIARAYDTSWIASGQTLSAGQLKADLDEVQSRLAALENPDCPYGYAVSAKPYIASNPYSVQCKNGNDTVVKVGVGKTAFWIDQYEASIWSTPTGSGGTQYGLVDNDAHNANFLRNGQWTVPMYALSIVGVTPSAYLTWFQANEACRLGGKRLPNGDEWLVAAGGTFDPGANDGTENANCNTASSGPRLTGSGAAGCVSRWGAEDMIGNITEWTSEWVAAPGDGTGSSFGPSPATWPIDYGTVGAVNGSGADGTNNLNTFVYRDEVDTPANALPATIERGGSYSSSSTAGIYKYAADSAPSRWLVNIGFRCIIR